MKGEWMAAGLFLLFQIWLASSLGGSIPALVLLAAAVIAALFSRQRFIIPKHWKMIGLVTLGLLFVAIAKMSSTTAEADDLLAWRAWLMGLAMFCMGYQTCELWERKKEAHLPGYLVALGVAVVVCLFSQATVNRPALAISTAIMAVFLAAIQFDFSAGKAWSIINQPFATRSLVIYAVLASVAVSTGYIDEFFLRNVPRLQNWLETAVRVNAGQSQSVRSYMRNATLSSVAFEKRTDPNIQTLLVESTKMPGYMRGAAFDSFDGTTWHRRRVYADVDPTLTMRSISPANPQAKEIPPDLPLDKDMQLFPLHPEVIGPWLKLSVTNDPRRGEMYFSPLEADYVQLPGGKLFIDNLDVVRGKIDTKVKYSYFVGKTETTAALPAEQMERLLRVPETLSDRLQPLSSKVFSSKVRTSAEKIAVVENYFHSTYKYSLDGFVAPKNTTPLMHFLEQHPAAHCEFFASGAALLLRLQGVPCRYVTGYVVTTSVWGESTKWVARNRDAHAWVEAYDAEAKTWRIVEATPGVDVPKSLKNEMRNDAQQQAGAATNASVTLDDNLWNTKRWWIFFRAATLDRWLMLGSASVLILGFAWYLWQRYVSRRNESTLSVERRKLRAMLAKLDRRLRKHRLQRERVETLHQFARRIRAVEQNEPWLQHAADWYLEYAQIVYGRSADAQSLRELATRLP